jgi:tRNA threonylcarbamoyl adenosine modification protein YeaZ
MLDRVQLDFSAIDRIAVTTGPGSFTGLRVGIAAARGIALASGKPAIGLTTLAAFAAPFIAADDTLPAPRGSDRDVTDAIALAFRRLSPELQAVAALALIDEQPYADIADALGIPVGTVKSRVFRATRFLREELARLGVRPC